MPATTHTGRYTYTQLEALWVHAGGSAAFAPLMAAIALAESNGNAAAVNGSSGATGLWQIHPGGDQYKDPQTNARAAVAKLHTQGLGAWEAYTNGAYKRYLPTSRGGAAGGSQGQAQTAAWWNIPNPIAPSIPLVPGIPGVGIPGADTPGLPGVGDPLGKIAQALGVPNLGPLVKRGGQVLLGAVFVLLGLVLIGVVEAKSVPPPVAEAAAGA